MYEIDPGAQAGSCLQGLRGLLGFGFKGLEFRVPCGKKGLGNAKLKHGIWG